VSKWPKSLDFRTCGALVNKRALPVGIDDHAAGGINDHDRFRRNLERQAVTFRMQLA
jgi:hypothetical protein